MVWFLTLVLGLPGQSSLMEVQFIDVPHDSYESCMETGDNWIKELNATLQRDVTKDVAYFCTSKGMQNAAKMNTEHWM